MKNDLKRIQRLITFNQGTFSIAIGKNDALESLEIYYLVKDISKILNNLAKLSNKGYINDPLVDLPITRWFVEEYKLLKTIPKSFSIYLNKTFFNLFLLLLLNLIINIEKQSSNILIDELLDLKTDIKTAYRGVLRMMNPIIRDCIGNKGLSVYLNTLVGYDSEYELRSSLNNMNDLLSIQLAGCTGMVLKVPILKSTFTIDRPNSLSRDEKTLVYYCNESMDKLLYNIREMLYKENDNLLNNLLIKLRLLNLQEEKTECYTIFTFPKSSVKTLIKYVEQDGFKYDKTDIFIKEYSSTDLIKDSDNLNNDNHEKSLIYLIELINEACGTNEISNKLQNSIKNSSNKHLSRITYRKGELRLSITINRIMYLCMHESSADLSMLNDFEEFKKNLNIVARSFVTLGKPLLIEGCLSKVHIRDTVLIAPGGAKSLAGVGSIYGDDFKKIDIGSYRNGNMRKLLSENKPLYDKYAIQDSLIPLKHASTMEDFNLTVGKIGVPLTISGLGKSYVLKEWRNMLYKGYQIRDDMIIGNVSSYLTPKGVRAVDISNYIVPFIASYRGGRNESFMYGIDNIKDERMWVDYDLTSCYTTVMSILGHPDINKAVRLYNQTVIKMSDRELLFNYIVIEVDFKFPVSVKYPCIPTRVDDNVDIYPREGRSIITGSEYLVAKNMGCHLAVRSGVMVPFSKSSKSKGINYFAPYRSIVKELQRKRRLYPKKTFYNYMYKEIGNSVYGQIAMGLSGKKSFDIKTNSHQNVPGGVLANPILSSYITGFTRALIGECMHNIQLLNGLIISVTTDGFITDVTDLEDKILSLKNKNKNCLLLYREIRRHLTTFKVGGEYDERALEIKCVETSGIISCKTRAQFGFTDGGILAATGLQTKNLNKSFLIEEISSIFNSVDKVIEYIQTGLRSANDIYKHGGHVISTYKDRSFSFNYDNKRRIIDNGQSMLDSVPWRNIIEYGRIRDLVETVSKPVYSKLYETSGSKSYKSYIETSVRGFVKACLSDNKNNRYGIPIDAFKDYRSIIDFIHKYEPARVVKLSLSSMSRLRHRNSISRTVPRTKENESFVSYISETFDGFDGERFFKELSKEAIQKLKTKT